MSNLKIAGDITAAMYRAGAPRELYVTVYRKRTGKIKAYYPSQNGKNPKQLAEVLRQSIKRVSIFRKTSQYLPEGRQLVTIYFRLREKPQAKEAGQKSQPDCAYCGTGGDGTYICQACRDAGIDGPVLRGGNVN